MRFVAYLIDSLITTVPVLVAVVLIVAVSLPSLHCTILTTNGVGYESCSGLGQLFAATGFAFLFSLLVPAVYFTVMWSWQGQSVGQKLFGLHVVDARTGTRISTGRALGRFVGLLISAAVLYIGLIWAAFDPQGQGWHDKMASTFVVQAL